ncbi:uncharacterized protein K444DRAFT_617100 [Hyaloscypha bicolor E]|uniref:Cx9C motif-containing protein 4, mitochondrial n=1 Tax=Hyaloscypha bicolor E TaxID=1095630 RepID=A0A2J6SZ17_9HELO|nr:uncharacterized protein K444DRAFT_617100 [Hyaloscypha bicolor E]PMD56004.1 hypothetical protein K444DRAFT_617100 [Hyaloscypha bicolor E]
MSESAQYKVSMLAVCGRKPPNANESFKDCLAKNSYNEAKCRSQVDALYKCCNAFYAQNGDNAKSASCPKASLLKLKMKQRADEGSK